MYYGGIGEKWQPHGEGTWYRRDGRIYTGEFVDGKVFNGLVNNKPVIDGKYAAYSFKSQKYNSADMKKKYRELKYSLEEFPGEKLTEDELKFSVLKL